jgi:hypothetical protein
LEALTLIWLDKASWELIKETTLNKMENLLLVVVLRPLDFESECMSIYKSMLPLPNLKHMPLKRLKDEDITLWIKHYMGVDFVPPDLINLIVRIITSTR